MGSLQGFSFTFAHCFTCWVSDGVVWVEQYSEGSYPLEHIKTKEQFISLYEILTGKEWKN